MKTYAVVMAAGKGTRMKSDKPKVVHEVLYKPMVCHIVDELKGLGVDGQLVIPGLQLVLNLFVYFVVAGLFIEVAQCFFPVLLTTAAVVPN